MWTSRDCRAECISEGDHLTRFSWQPTNYSGMDAEVHSHVGVTESSRPSCSAQVDSADKPRRQPEEMLAPVHLNVTVWVFA